MKQKPAKQFNLHKPVNPRGSFYVFGTTEEEEEKHNARVREAKERKEKKQRGSEKPDAS